MRGAWVSVGDGGLEETVFDIGPEEIVMLGARWMKVIGDYNVRGNIKTVVSAEHTQKGFQKK
jgi:7-cyano-7-deazaguanine reductase